MAICLLCESSRAEILDVEKARPEDCGPSVIAALSQLGTHPLILHKSLLRCPDCKRQYRLIKLPIEESYAKNYLRMSKN